MKKVISRVVIIAALVAIAWMLYYIYPKDVYIHTEGVKYRLGDLDTGTLTNVEVKGKLIHSITGKRTFKGTIWIEGEPMPVPEHSRKLTLKFSSDNSSTLAYVYSDNGQVAIHHVGSIYINGDFSEFTLTLTEKDEDGSYSWNGGDGLMLSAPASNREEALKLSNELMESILIKGHELQ